MAKKFILVFEETNISIENAHVKELYNGPGLYIINSGEYKTLVHIPEDALKSPQYMTIDSKDIESIINKGSKEVVPIEGFEEPKEHNRQQSNIDIPVMEWVSADTLIKVVELLAKK